MWPNDADGNAIRAALGPLLEKAGYTIVDPGAYEDGTTDYSSPDREVQAGELRDLQHVPDPAGLRDVLAAGRPAGLPSVRIAQIAKTGLFPSQVEALGALGYNLASGAYWHPTFPYSSQLDT